MRPGMGPDDKISNTMMYVNDVLKDVAAILAVSDQTQEPEPSMQVVKEERSHTALLFEPYTLELESEENDIMIENDVKKETLDEKEVLNSWYEVGMDTSVLRLNEIMTGFCWNDNDCEQKRRFSSCC